MGALSSYLFLGADVWSDALPLDEVGSVPPAPPTCSYEVPRRSGNFYGLFQGHQKAPFTHPGLELDLLERSYL